MSKKIFVNVMSKSSIQNAARLCFQYQAKLEARLTDFVEALADVGIKVIELTMSAVPPFDVGSYYVDLTLQQNGNTIVGRLKLHGDQVAFIEFSAGITYGSAPGTYPLPSGSEMGYGTYHPGSRNATNPNGWYYRTDDGALQHTLGTAAHMPMYKADMKMREDVERIAKRIFATI